MLYRDKKGAVFEIRSGGPEDIPGRRYQCLPPTRRMQVATGCNLIAIRLYRKCGFNFCDKTCWDEERKMMLLFRKEDKSSC